MGSRALETATSLEPYLNRRVLFVQGIPSECPKNEVLSVLTQACRQPQQGRIDILTTPEGRNRGTAFLNFHNLEAAKEALEKWRFGLELRDRELRLQYSSDKEFKDVIQSPAMSRFKVLVRNIPEELAPQDIFDAFSEHGEILQLHTNVDHHGTYFAIVQYTEVAAAQKAVRLANGSKVLSNVLTVEPYRPNQPLAPLSRAGGQAGSQAGAQARAQAPAQEEASGPAALQRPVQGMTYAALQQQQEREAEAAAAAAAAAAQYQQQQQQGGAGEYQEPEDAEGPGASRMLAIPTFYATAAAGAPQGPTEAGSLASLLTTALHHVRAVEDLLCCPITQEPLQDPVVAADGNTYERAAIEAWLVEHSTSPMSNQTLPHKLLIPNNLVRKIMDDMAGKTAAAGDTPPAAASAAPAANGPAAAYPAAAAPVSAPAEVAPAPAAPEPLRLPIPVPTPVAAVQAPQAVQPPEPGIRYAPQQPQQQAQHAQQQPVHLMAPAGMAGAGAAAGVGSRGVPVEQVRQIAQSVGAMLHARAQHAQHAPPPQQQDVGAGQQQAYDAQGYEAAQQAQHAAYALQAQQAQQQMMAMRLQQHQVAAQVAAQQQALQYAQPGYPPSAYY
ncbi:hypothetical protein HYH03_013119 [Edaphochlamys debaryana]|uniref:Uncharacterized protein n=1 Tax=Edaphochlamys debaryana TaxID=47281 RepID=A0A835XQA1_9CHLO|nr:hypothetical protein HYH03_013119 [Edaphochlamys debaryana]|eukprot:KAG2488268.1 hypothetical protein HYH03_013119 [Edaphochlamys debaryana]